MQLTPLENLKMKSLCHQRALKGSKQWQKHLQEQWWDGELRETQGLAEVKAKDKVVQSNPNYILISFFSSRFCSPPPSVHRKPCLFFKEDRSILQGGMPHNQCPASDTYF